MLLLLLEKLLFLLLLDEESLLLLLLNKFRVEELGLLLDGALLQEGCLILVRDKRGRCLLILLVLLLLLG